MDRYRNELKRMQDHAGAADFEGRVKGRIADLPIAEDLTSGTTTRRR
jgi:hypothetical protein